MFFLLLAQETTTRLVWSRLPELHAWWHWPVLIAASFAILAWTSWLYRRDAIELPRWTGITLIGLRWIAVIALVLYFFGLERRSEQRSVRNSRLAVLIDTSQSMGMLDDTQPDPGTRMDRIRELFGRHNWLSQQCDQHDVVLYAVSDSETPTELGILPLRKSSNEGTSETMASATDTALGPPDTELGQPEVEGSLVAAGAVAGAVLFVVFLWQWFRGQETPASRWLGASVTVLILAGAGAAYRELSLNERLELDSDQANLESETPPESLNPSLDIDKSLDPRVDVTRLGDSIAAILQQNRNQPLAALVVFSDGAQNQGKDPLTATQIAKQQTVPIYSVGYGNSSLPRNVTLVDLQMPPRIYPQDQFQAIAYVQGHQVAGQTIEIQLRARPAEAVEGSEGTTKGDVEQLVDTQRVEISDDQPLTTVRFDLEPPASGTWSYRAVVAAVPQEVNLADNERASRVEVVDRRTRVLLIAGGPTREYQFVRNQLHRDRSMQSDVWLQTASKNSTQEAQQNLTSFPTDPQQLYAYDAVVAFDPDWGQLSVEQGSMLERWVAEDAGGLLLIAGPVHTSPWAESNAAQPASDKIRSLYPVDFYRRGHSRLGLGRSAGDRAWPPQFTNEGQNARFLWLGDTSEESSTRWSTFAGFYSYYAVRGPKLGATVYASFSDPDTAIRGEYPPYIVGQYYGSGRSLFLASGELWRLREVDVSYQEQLYTKLVRFVSEGRLLRDSQHGMLILDKQRCMRGERIAVRAQLRDKQLQPWVADSVEATLTAPDGTKSPLPLPSLNESPGTFQASFVAEQPGTYLVMVPIPEGDVYERLSREVEVRLAERELEQPLRGDNLLSQLARDTGGAYYLGTPAVLGQGETPSLASSLRPRPQVAVVEGAPDINFDRRWMKWLMVFLCGSLCVEWLVRRLHRLA